MREKGNKNSWKKKPHKAKCRCKPKQISDYMLIEK